MERKFHVSNRKPVSRVRSSRRRPGCIRLFVCPTTGGRLEISVSPRETVLGLKAALARKLRVSPSKITLIYKDKVLKDGCIQDHQIPDESHVTLLPNMESGLSLHQSDKSIMQALENLTETQVNDFLSGRSPLMLAIRMGENMVFVQLQLSMLQGQGHRPPQPRPNVTPMTPAAAAVLSQAGLSPSAIAEATRCLSQRLHRLQEMNGTSSSASSSSSSSSGVRPNTNLPTTSTPRLSQPPVGSHPRTPPPTTTPTTTGAATSASTSTTAASAQTMFPLPPRQPVPNLPENPSLPENPLPSPPPSPGAIIDNMKHLGRGVYTGTFQGTLDPSLQDGNGQPKKSVSTILHILNDLLVAAPNSPAPTQGQGQSSAHIRPQCPCHSPSLPLTPPSSPLSKASPAPVFGPQDDPDNAMLRGKMQRIQMMLAQRKEQRRTRREMGAPYTTSRSAQKLLASQSLLNSSSFTSSSPSSSSSSSSPVCMAATASTSKSSDSGDVNHGEGGSDPASTYCKPNIEQDSLAV